jgi:hypothetical protein
MKEIPKPLTKILAFSLTNSSQQKKSQGGKKKKSQIQPSASTRNMGYSG